MSLNLQPALTSTPLADGLPVQSRDGATVQPLSFGEVLKVEEKKLQHEQEINALSVAALLAMPPLPAMTESIHGFEAGAGAESAKPNDQTALTVDSAKPANASPQQHSLPGSQTGAVRQIASTLTENRPPAASFVTNTKAAPITGTETKVEKTDLKISVPANEISQPVKATVASSAKSTAPEISHETKKTESVQTEDSAKEISQPVKATVAPTAKLATPEVSIETKIAESVKTDVPAKEISQPVKATVALTTKSAALEVSIETKMAESVKTDAPANEISQPAKVTVAPTAKSATPEISIEMKMVEPAKTEASATEISQPVKVTVAPTTKSPTPEISNETKKAETAQTDAPVIEISQPAKVTVAPTTKSAAPEISHETLAQTDAPANGISQPVEKINIPAVKVDAQIDVNNEITAKQTTLAADAKAVEVQTPNIPARNLVENIEAPVADKFAPDIKSADQKPITHSGGQKDASNLPPVPSPILSSADAKTFNGKPAQVVEISQPMTSPLSLAEAEEINLKNKGGKVAPSLGGDNATAESRVGTGNMPKVKSEAFAIAQGNTPASAQPETAAQFSRVEIKSDEKVTAKEPALDLESKVVIAGTDKEIVGVDVVKKSSVAQVDGTAMDVIEQITSQMKVRIKSGETSIRMQLNPEKLGAIEVQMTHGAQGISVSFITEQASTGQLIESQVNQLRQSLKDAGVQLANLNISQQHQSNHEGGAFKQGQQFVQNPRRDVSQVEALSEERTRPQRIDGLTSEIDYLV